jgi:hypothetical protein
MCWRGVRMGPSGPRLESELGGGWKGGMERWTHPEEGGF